MINENERIENNRTKIDFFMREKVKVHVDKTDKSWLNGTFISKLSDDVYILKDDVLGEQHIFLKEVYKVANFRAPKNQTGRPKYRNF